MYNVFIVTSAIHTHFGIFSPEIREQQTFETIKSIKERVPNSFIILSDMGKSSISNRLVRETNCYFDLSTEPNIQQYQKFPKKARIYAINLMETLGIIRTLELILKEPTLKFLLSNSDYFFKLSGRYVLNDNFKLGNLVNENTFEKYIFKTKEYAFFTRDFADGKFVRQTRLWGFHHSLLVETYELYNKVYNMMHTDFFINKDYFHDIEQSIEIIFPTNKICNVDVMGVEGSIADRGIFISE